MMIECPKCWPDKEMTRHRVTWLSGEKESYYELRCSRCGDTRTIYSQGIEDLKKAEAEYKRFNTN